MRLTTPCGSQRHAAHGRYLGEKIRTHHFFIISKRARSGLRGHAPSRAIIEYTMNWNNYTEIYDLYIESTRVLRLYGRKKALQRAQSMSSDLFEGHKHVEVVNIHTGEIIYKT